MKIKEIAALARECNSVTLVNEEKESETTRQWLVIGGNHMYPLDGLPVLNEEQLMAIIDVPMKKRESFRVFVSEMTDHLHEFAADFHAGDQDAEMSSLEICLWGSTKIRCAMAEDGTTVFVNTKYLKPLADQKKDLTFVIRKHDEHSATLVVKRGMLNVCSISSMDLWVGEKEMHELVVMSRHAQRAERENREREANANR